MTLALLALAAALVLTRLPDLARGRLLALTSSGRLVGRVSRPDQWSRLRPELPTRRFALSVSLLAAAGAGLSVGVPLGLAAGVAVLTTGSLLAAAGERRRVVARRRSLITSLRLLAAELQAGAQPREALAACGSSAPELRVGFAAAAAVAASGGEVAEALTAAGGELCRLGHAWRVVEVTGAPLVEVVNRLVHDLSAAEDQRRAVTVALAGPRSSAMLLAGLPVLGVGLGAALGAAPGKVLLGSSAGQLLCCAGILLDAAGVAWTQWLTGRADPP
jgi:tight adherence protein B